MYIVPPPIKYPYCFSGPDSASLVFSWPGIGVTRTTHIDFRIQMDSISVSRIRIIIFTYTQIVDFQMKRCILAVFRESDYVFYRYGKWLVLNSMVCSYCFLGPASVTLTQHTLFFVSRWVVSLFPGP